MRIEIKKLAVNKDTPFVRKILIASDPGVGKSHLIGTIQSCPAMADLLHVDLDGGAATLLSRGDISGTSARSVADVEEVLGMIARKDPAVANIKTLALDGLSELARREVADIAVLAAKGNSKRDPNANELRDFMLAKNRMLRILRMARELPITVVMTAWTKRVYPNKPGTTTPDTSAAVQSIVPDVSESIRSTLSGLVDDSWIYVYDAASNKRYLYTGNVGVIVAKTRDSVVASKFTSDFDGKQLPIVVDPTFTDLYKRYQAAYTI